MGYFKQPISEEIFKMKYCLHGEDSPKEVFHYISKEIASVEMSDEKKLEWEQKFYDELASGRLIPAGRILANARPNSPMKQYNNCFTIGINDSLEDIFESLKEDALISGTGGGVGFNVSNLRPKGTPLSKGGESSGVISFLKVFDASAKVIMTGGARRSAHIAILDISHPEIESFITCKRGEENNALTQFNISVGINNKFIEAVESDSDWDLVFDGKVYKTVKARYLYDLMAENAFIHNEPGIFNRDTVNKFNNGYWAFTMDQCNPCGEITMPEYSLCCLSAINLTKFVGNPFTHRVFFNFQEFKKTVDVGIRFLDNVLDATSYPLDKIEQISKAWRRIGLGFTGLGNVFTMMGMKYGSEESKQFSETLGLCLRDYSYEASALLAKEKGAFPECDVNKLLQSEFIKQISDSALIKLITKHGLRNIGMNTIAPTGTTSLSLGENCSSGIEPCFSLKYDRRVRTGRGDETTKQTVYDYAYLVYKEMFGEDAEIPEYFSTTLDVDPKDSIDIQAIFQKYIDHSISKTLNLPMGTTFEEYKDLFMYAYKKGLKGFTTFNPEGSMRGVLEHQDKKEKEEDVDRLAPKRPKTLPAEIHYTKHKGTEFMVLVGMLDNAPYELFVSHFADGFKEKTGSIEKYKKGHYRLLSDAGEVIIEDLGTGLEKEFGMATRLLSLSLRHQDSSTPMQFIVDSLMKDKDFISFSRSVGRVLKKYVKNGEKNLSSKTCPKCGSDNLIFQEGCLVCPDCGESKCG